MLQKLDLTIRRGETVNLPIRVESDTLGYANITSISQTAPVVINATGHGIPDGWRVAVVNVRGMIEINAEVATAGSPPRISSMHRITVVDSNTIQINDINAANFHAYTSGGQLVYYTPFSLSSFSAARLNVKDKIGGSILAYWSTADSTLELDNINNAVWLRLSATQTAALGWSKGVFDIELISGSTITALCSAESTITVLPEVTTGD